MNTCTPQNIESMKRVTPISVVVIFFLLSVKLLFAKVKLPAILSSNMVLQRNATVTLWGGPMPAKKSL